MRAWSTDAAFQSTNRVMAFIEPRGVDNVPDEVTMARLGLLDALEALEAHLDALVITGAQAVDLHTGATEIALAEFTTDGDVAVDPDLLSSDPRVEDAMRAGGFTPDPGAEAFGCHRTTRNRCGAREALKRH